MYDSLRKVIILMEFSRFYWKVSLYPLAFPSINVPVLLPPDPLYKGGQDSKILNREYGLAVILTQANNRLLGFVGSRQHGVDFSLNTFVCFFLPFWFLDFCALTGPDWS